MEISLYGFSGKILNFLEKMLDFIFQTVTVLERSVYNMVHEDRIKMYEKRFEDPEKQAQSYMKACLVEHVAMPEESFDWLKKHSSFEGFEKFTRGLFKKNMLHRIVLYCHGNLELEQVKEFTEKTSKYIDERLVVDESEIEMVVENGPPKKKLGKIPYKLEDGKTLKTLKARAKNKDNKSSIVVFYIDLTEDTIKTRILAHLLNQLFDTEFFNELRTKQQIGYIANSYSNVHSNLRLGMEIWVTSSKIESEKIIVKIEEFLNSFLKETLANMPEKEFEELKSSVMSIKMQPYLSMQEVGQINWVEILDQTLVFDRKLKEIEILQEVNFNQFRDWVNGLLSHKKKFFSVQIIPMDDHNVHENLIVEAVKPAIDKSNYYTKDWKF